MTPQQHVPPCDSALAGNDVTVDVAAPTTTSPRPPAPAPAPRPQTASSHTAIERLNTNRRTGRQTCLSTEHPLMSVWLEFHSAPTTPTGGATHADRPCRCHVLLSLEACGEDRLKFNPMPALRSVPLGPWHLDQTAQYGHPIIS